jgi:general secretion pathway protein D
VVRSKEASSSITMDRYEYIRAAGETQYPAGGEPLLRELGAPVLPPLTNGQPPPGSGFAPVPPAQPAPPRNAPGLVVPATGAAVRPGTGQTPQAAPPTQR